MTTSSTLNRYQIENGVLTADELKKLLQELASTQTSVSIRLQFRNGDWPPYFSQVLVFAKQATLLAHIPSRTILNVPDLTQVSAFELDHSFKNYRASRIYLISASQPTTHYTDGLLHA